MRKSPTVKWNGVPDYDCWYGYHLVVSADDAINIKSWIWEAEEYIKYLEGLI